MNNNEGRGNDRDNDHRDNDRGRDHDHGGMNSNANANIYGGGGKGHAWYQQGGKPDRAQYNRVRAQIHLGQFRMNVTSHQRFHANFTWNPPRGYHYRHYRYGQHLPRIYFVQDYWIDDYYDYDLIDPPYGFVWVRFGPDAILVDEFTGEIVQVVYNVFW